ncbi:hypothetical protein NQ315_014171 [Exocentrus adspersus]|uniref:Uncharacterized protein n=1 Tax=Exocentrus adspersus TaxID=1586481 RepID=A0AAV8VV92_9CUCU|nr:hypothetical protein NQ315_014171 [Exocentrus adspersus]
MKALVFLASVLSLSVAIEIFDVNSLNIENLEFEIEESFVYEFLEKYDQEVTDDSGIVAIVNEYADKIFKNIEVFAVKSHLDPLNLTDVENDFLGSSINLTNGHLDGISTIDRADDVVITYHSSEKTLEIYLPIVFSNLNFTYDYHVIILLIGPKGSIVGKIRDFTMDLKLLFDFNTYHATVESVQTTNTGHVSLTFHGNGIVDIVVNTLSEFVTAILQPLVGLVVEDVVKDVANLVIDTVNNAIDSIFGTSSTTDIDF